MVLRSEFYENSEVRVKQGCKFIWIRDMANRYHIGPLHFCTNRYWIKNFGSYFILPRPLSEFNWSEFYGAEFWSGILARSFRLKLLARIQMNQKMVGSVIRDLGLTLGYPVRYFCISPSRSVFSKIAFLDQTDFVPTYLVRNKAWIDQHLDRNLEVTSVQGQFQLVQWGIGTSKLVIRTDNVLICSYRAVTLE